MMPLMTTVEREADPHLVIESLDKTYETRTGTVAAVEKVSLAAARGEFVSIVGPSGCGKSTLLKIILGVVEPSGGRIHIAGAKGGEARVGMVFQSPALPPWRTVLGNVLLPIEALGMRKADHVEKARQLLRLAGLEAFEDKYPRELSGGMQQRVAICRALVHDPELLLMDEPFGALDALTREVMQGELLRIWGETGKTVLFVTHSIDEAVLLSNRVIVMSARPGRIVEELAIEIGQPRHPDVRTRSDFQEYARRLRHHLGVAHD